MNYYYPPEDHGVFSVRKHRASGRLCIKDRRGRKKGSKNSRLNKVENEFIKDWERAHRIQKKILVKEERIAKIKKKRELRRKKKEEYQKQICDMYRQGKTLHEVGEAFGITRERVRQIAKENGITQLEGGRTIRSLLNIEDKVKEQREKALAKERKCYETWGCSIEQYRSIRNYGVGVKKDPSVYYSHQRHNAKLRGIKWDLTLWEWWTIWEESGKYSQRGRKKDQYVMSRIGDMGGYTKDNVQIITASENAKEYYEFHKEEHREIVRKGWKNKLRRS